MITKKLNYLEPPVLAVASLLFYIGLYRPRPGSEDFITGLLVFFAALGLGAAIVFTRRRDRWFFYIYVSVAVGGPIGTALFLKYFNGLWHTMIIGLVVLSITILRFYLTSFSPKKQQREKNRKQDRA